MTTPARLKYTNSNNNEEIIGVFRPDQPTNGRINTFTVDHDARGYARVIIEGEPGLQRDMPVVDSDFGTSEREIIVEIDKNKDGTWEKRARVYPEGPGTTDDQGNYKHKNLWGFKRDTGEDRATISTPVTTNIKDVLEQGLPSGYTVVYPSDKTPPSVNGFTHDDLRQQLYNDLEEDFEHFIIFTPNEDGNGDIEVKLQPQGYGGTQFSLVRGQDPMVYDFFKPQDTSEVISEVKVVGENRNGAQIVKTFTPADYNDLSSADKTRSKNLRLGYLGGTKSEAESEAKAIAKNHLNPQASTNLALDTTLRPTNNLNQSVGIIDDSRYVDQNNTLDDEFTVVKQKDFFHEGMTYLSFEFESESTKKQRRKWRKHDEQQRRIYPSEGKGVGNQNVNTGDALSNTSKQGGVGDDNDRNDDLSNVTKGGGVGDSNDRNDDFSNVTKSGTVNEEGSASNTFLGSDTSWANVSSSGWTTVADQTNVSSGNYLFHEIIIEIQSIDGTYNLDIAVQDGGLAGSGNVIFHDNPQEVGSQDSEEDLSRDVYYHKRVLYPVTALYGFQSDRDYLLRISSKGSGSPTIDGRFEITGINHTHNDDITADDNAMGLTDDITADDNAMGLTDDITTDDDLHGGGSGDDQHGGDTDAQDINVTVQNRTDRS